ncbi:MAG: NeuD/PglB/VioB family sugar acetyltransferase [Clostridiales Family XIII bacterium]|jgi:sugar O-acyltransferase (sialic acid O-acetyltransferase NeuD family)|nr:NeuD/PglB/VioB family sugar acetyltransferase [Clostridiales Family XIII bacterium]
MTEKLKELYIIGAGGLGREVADTVVAINQQKNIYRIAGFVDDNEVIHGSAINDIPVLGGRDLFKQRRAAREIYAVIAIADVKIRKAIAEDLDGFVTWENIIHPAAIVSAHCEIGRGNIVQAFCSVSANARFGNHCIFNAGSLLGHDAILEDYVSVMRRCDVNGHVRLRTGVYLGSSVLIVPDVTIGENAFLCAGSAIFKDVDDDAVMIGNPAKRIR